MIPSTCPEEIYDAFWRRVDKSGSCWMWKGATRGMPLQGLYGDFQFRKTRIAAHRFSYTISKGRIPIGLYACHKCDNTLCVKPDHLFLGTNQDNQLDASRKGRSRNQHTGKPVCKRGHPLCGANVYTGYPKGRATRYCRACKSIHQKRYYYKTKKEAA